MSEPVVAADRWIYSVLTGDGTLAPLIGTRVFIDFVPEETTYPYIYGTMPSAGDDLQVIGGRSVWSVLSYTLRYVDKGEDYTALEAGAAAMKSALNRSSGSNVSGVIFACIYRRPFRMTDIARDGATVLELGGFYDLFVQ